MAIEVQITLDTSDKIGPEGWVLFAKRALKSSLDREKIAWHELSVGEDCSIWFKKDRDNTRQYRLRDLDRAVVELRV